MGSSTPTAPLGLEIDVTESPIFLTAPQTCSHRRNAPYEKSDNLVFPGWLFSVAFGPSDVAESATLAVICKDSG